jgi:hypothetical protein
MTEQRQSRGRWNEAELRHRPPPRIPHVPLPAEKRQTSFTLVALLVIMSMIIWFAVT